MNDNRPTDREKEIRGRERDVAIRFIHPDGTPVNNAEAIISFHTSRFAEGIDDDGYIYLDLSDLRFDRPAHISVPILRFDLNDFLFTEGKRLYTVVVG